MSNTDSAIVSFGSGLMSGGGWATQQILSAMRRGDPITAGLLRTCDTLRKDEWIDYDEAVVEEGAIRLRGIADLINAGLTRPIANALGKTVAEYERVTDMSTAEVTMSGQHQADNEALDYTLAQSPLPIHHKDFRINLRTLAGSRDRGEPLDTTMPRLAARKVIERLELTLFQGGPTFATLPLYGYMTFPDRNTAGFSAGTWTGGAITGQDMLNDLLAWKQILIGDGFYGPYMLYLPTAYETVLDQDWSTQKGDITIRQRLLQVESIDEIKIVDQLPADNVVMVQMTSDVVQLLDGESLQTVQWDVPGGFEVRFKVMLIQSPLMKSTSSGDCGILHAS